MSLKVNTQTSSHALIHLYALENMQSPSESAVEVVSHSLETCPFQSVDYILIWTEEPVCYPALVQ